MENKNNTSEEFHCDDVHNTANDLFDRYCDNNIFNNKEVTDSVSSVSSKHKSKSTRSKFSTSTDSNTSKNGMVEFCDTFDSIDTLDSLTLTESSKKHKSNNNKMINDDDINNSVCIFNTDNDSNEVTNMLKEFAKRANDDSSFCTDKSNNLQNELLELKKVLNSKKKKRKSESKSGTTSSSGDELEYLQTQINCLHKKVNNLLKVEKVNDNRYKQVISELDVIIGNVEKNDERFSNMIDNPNNFERKSKYNDINKSESIAKDIETPSEHQFGKAEPNKLFFADTDKTHKFVIDKDICIIFITAVAGGGAGGVGCIDGLKNISGGGGGSGASIIKKPVVVDIGATISITIGKGGSSNTCEHGQNTTIKIMTCKGQKEVICLDGGKNGHPYAVDDIKFTEGGNGGKSCIELMQGKKGDSGIISYPSQMCSNGGNGGGSHFYDGGKGASNVFDCGGKGGTSFKGIGENGKFGSGGGGSSPKMRIDLKKKLSGNGGSGFVLIEW